MSGGQLVVIDRAGRDGKQFVLADGMATLGCDPDCDIRIMLPTVRPHHATIVVHANQTVIRNVCADETLVNGRGVSVAALRHGDVIGIGGRHLRWEYADAGARRPQVPLPALGVARRGPRAARRASGPAPARARDPALQLRIEMSHRASMPGSAGGKQVAIVQPQRRPAATDTIDKLPPRTPQQANRRPRTSKSDLETSVNEAELERATRKSSARASPNCSLPNLQSTTKASLWCESRKGRPELRARRHTAAHHRTPLRLTVLKRAQSARKCAVTKIEGPLTIDHTKQAAIRLMTGHAPKSAACSPSLVVKKPSPLRRPPRTRSSRAGSVTILELTDSDGRNSSARHSSASRRSTQKSPRKSPGSTSPRKSALKDPSAKRGARKTESIKFDLSNLEGHSDDVLMLSDSACASDDDVTLRYSPSPAPSPRRSIHSRSSRMLESTLGSSAAAAPPAHRAERSERSERSPRSQRSSRGSLMVQNALNHTNTSTYSRRTTKSVTDSSHNSTVATAYRTRTLSPRTSRNDLESYSIVDLVSIDTDESTLSTSVYGSAGSAASTAFGTPQKTTGRKTRSTIEPTLLGSSTPYVKGRASTPRSRSDPSPQNSSKASMNGTQSTVRNSRSRRSKSLSTPENTEESKKHISVNSTRISRASRSRSRLNDSDLLLLDDDDDSPRTSRRISTSSKSARVSAPADDAELTPTHSPVQANGTCTPENRHSPAEASTPVLSIQSLLDSSQNSFASEKGTRKGRPSNTKRKTIGGVSAPKTRVVASSKSLSFSARKTRLRLSSDSVEILNNKNDESEIVTPKSAVKLVPEGVKNKHSTAKKPQSKRSIIDDLNESDIVKQLFSSPVKRKLAHSMTEFSRRQLFEELDHTGAGAARTPDHSLPDHTDSYTPEMFVSPITTPTRSPSLEGIKLMFAKTTPENDLRNVRGVKGLLRTPRTRRSIKNDLTDVSGVKKIFARSPKNRLSDVRVKEVFVASPKNDLRRVTGVKSLFQVANKRKSPRNELDDVRGVKKLFKANSPANDLRNVSGVKRTLRRQSPQNDLSDVRGLKRVFTREKRNDLSDVSGVEELFNLSNYSSATVSTRAESLFDQMVGKPQIRAVYSKTFSSNTVTKSKSAKAKSLHVSLDKISASDNDWLEQELNKRLQIKNYLDSLKSANVSKANTSRANRSKQNKSKSLHTSLDEVADVDVLLQQELNKEQQISNYLESMRSVNDSKVNTSKGNKSIANKSTPNRSKANRSKANSSAVNKSKANTSKASKTRELLKLVTDTVEGEAPLQTSRIRNSTVIRSNDSEAEPKSASELYGAHTLPIKKRSIVDSSQEQARLLPLKKRLLVHSTPLKGRLHHSMHAALVSPIRAHDRTGDSYTSTHPKETTEARPKSNRGTRAITNNQETANAPEFVKPSPKKTRGRSKVASPRAKPISPVEVRAAKTRRASPSKAKVASPIKSKKASPAKAKKASSTKAKKASSTKAKKVSPAKPKKASPAKTRKANPAKAKKARPAKAKKASPAKKPVSPVPVKASRSRRNNASTIEPNTKKRRASLVVAKKTPGMSPQPRATRKRKQPETMTTPNESPKKTRATRKNASVNADKPKTPKSTRAKVQRATVVVMKPSPQLKPRATRRAPADQSGPRTKPTARNTRTTVAVQQPKSESPKKSQAQKILSKTQAAEVQPKTRGTKTVINEPTEPEPKAKRARKTDQPAAKKTKNNTQEKSAEEAKPVRGRGKKLESQESVESGPSTRGRRGAKPGSIAPDVTTKTRKRKSDSPPETELPSKVRKSKEVAARGRKPATEVSTDTTNTRHKSAAHSTGATATRGKLTKQAEPKSLRGTKVNIENVSASQVAGKRKRAAAASPVEERHTRATRGPTQTEGKPTGRSRRR